MTYFLQNPDGNKNAMDCGDIYSWDETTIAYVLNQAPQEVHHNGRSELASARCDGCGEARRLLWQECECGSEDIEGFLVAPQDADLVRNPATALDRMWYHATDREGWLDSVISSGIGIHLGSQETSLDHGNREYRHKDSYFLYALRLIPSTAVSTSLCPDLSDRWTEDVGTLPQDFVAYVNAFEAPGQVSLYGRPTCVTVESVEIISL